MKEEIFYWFVCDTSRSISISFIFYLGIDVFINFRDNIFKMHLFIDSTKYQLQMEEWDKFMFFLMQTESFKWTGNNQFT